MKKFSKILLLMCLMLGVIGCTAQEEKTAPETPDPVEIVPEETPAANPDAQNPEDLLFFLNDGEYYLDFNVKEGTFKLTLGEEDLSAGGKLTKTKDDLAAASLSVENSEETTYNCYVVTIKENDGKIKSSSLVNFQIKANDLGKVYAQSARYLSRKKGYIYIGESVDGWDTNLSTGLNDLLKKVIADNKK